MRIGVAIIYKIGPATIRTPEEYPKRVTVEAEDADHITDTMVEEQVRLQLAHRRVQLRTSLSFGYVVIE